MLPLISAPTIVAIDQGSPLRIPDDIPEDPSTNPTLEYVVDENMQFIMAALKRDKGKTPMTAEQQAFHSRHPLKQKQGLFQEEINKALEDSIQIQALTDIPNSMRGIYHLWREGILRDHEIVPFMY